MPNTTLPGHDATLGRADAIDEVAHTLIPRAAQAMRLLQRRARNTMSRSEAGLLVALLDGPRRITELAEAEGHAQPTTTLLVKRLEERGHVARERDPGDGRAVLVSLTPQGATALDEFRARYRAVMRDQLGAMSDEQIAALLAAAEALDTLNHTLRGDDLR